MAIKVIYTSDAGIVSDRKCDFAGALLRNWPTGTAQLLALSSGMSSKDASDTVVTWFEENHLSGRVNITNNAASGTSFIVDDANQTVVGAVLLVEESGEYVFVTAVAGNDLTVERGFAGTPITAVDGSGTPKALQKISTAHEEGSSRPVAIANLGYPRINYTQIFRNSWDLTGTARAVEHHTGDVIAKNRMDASFIHADDIEKSMWFSRKSIGVRNNKPFRTMDGIITQIVTNVQAQATNVEWDDLNIFLRDIFQRNIKGKPNERIAFCGNTVVGVINKIAQYDATVNITPGETEFGLKVMKWITPYGTVSLMTHPLFNESPFWTKNLYVLHPAAIRTRWLRRTNEDAYDTDGSRAGEDADYGVFTSELSIEYNAEITGGAYTGIDTAVATT